MTVRRAVAAALLAAGLLSGCAINEGISTNATSVVNPSPAPSSPIEPQENVNRTAAPSETEGPTATPGS